MFERRSRHAPLQAALGGVALSLSAVACASSTKCESKDVRSPKDVVSSPASSNPDWLTERDASKELVVPSNNDMAVVEELALDHYEVYKDARGNLFVLGLEGLQNKLTHRSASFFFGLGGELRAQVGVGLKDLEGGAGGDGRRSWRLGFFDPALPQGSAAIDITQQATTLRCGSTQHVLTPVAGEERRRAVEGASFLRRRWLPLALARQGEELFVYVDVAGEPQELSYRVLAGERGAMRHVATFSGSEADVKPDTLHSEDHIAFYVAGGILRCRTRTRGSCQLIWERNGATTYFVPMDPDIAENDRLYRAELGIYEKSPSPCGTAP